MMPNYLSYLPYLWYKITPCFSSILFLLVFLVVNLPLRVLDKDDFKLKQWT